MLDEKKNPTLKWTKEPPKKSGWYYFRCSLPAYKYASVVYVDAEKDMIRFKNITTWSIRETVKKYTVEWAGAIQEPVEETNAR